MIRIKTEKDIATLIEGGKRHAYIISEVSKLVSPGVLSSELENYAMELINEGGDKSAFLNYIPEGARRPYPAALCVSVNDEIVHGIPNEEDKRLQEGDIVSLDLGLIHGGLITDMAVTVGVGEVSKELITLIRATEEALMAGISEARGGNTVGDIGYAIQKVAKRYGFGLAEGLAGHGVGYEVHEDPFVPNTGKPGKGEKLVPGMVIAIEPMLVTGRSEIVLAKDGYTYKTADGSMSAHAEHTVAITEGDAFVLTSP
jgi:methionyl aminopeptidase